jgi:DNA helicase-2/ATP-dependent DNA helicase PcrA
MNTQSLSVQANAGTGKSTTIEWAVTKPPKGIKLSSQQEAIITFLKVGRKKISTRLTCFNKTIQEDLQGRMPKIECVTNNSLGNSTLRTHRGFTKCDGRKYFYLIKDLMGDPFKDKTLWPRISTINALVDMARSTLTGTYDELDYSVTIDELREMAETYCVSVDKWDDWEKVAEVINLGIEAYTKRGFIDFTDQIVLPHVFGIKPPKVCRAYVDEAQDSSPAQIELILSSCEQAIIVGDVNQSIYLWTGAAPDAIPSMETRLNTMNLPLSITRRCPKSHVEYAKRFLPPDTLFAAHEDNIDGTIITGVSININLYSKLVEDQVDNLFLSRTNAPLVKHCFQCFRHRIPAKIRGRNFVKQAQTKLMSLKGKTMSDCITELTNSFEKQINNLSALGKSDQVEAKQDELAVYLLFMIESETIQDAINTMEKMFSDENLAHGINFTSVHRAKGLEAHTTGILTPELMPPVWSLKNPTLHKQELNVAYVAHTRSKNTMFINAVKETN